MDGIIAGVSAVIGFIPQMIILFCCSRCSKGAATWRVAFIAVRYSSAASACRANFIPSRRVRLRH